LNSKLHAVCDDESRPLVKLLSEGRMSDYKGAGVGWLAGATWSDYSRASGSASRNVTALTWVMNCPPFGWFSVVATETLTPSSQGWTSPCRAFDLGAWT
jgi:hypothetical protein